MPPKIRQLIQKLNAAGFVQVRQKGNHRHFKHASGFLVTISGKAGDDAHHYQRLLVRKAIDEVSNEEK